VTAAETPVAAAAAVSSSKGDGSDRSYALLGLRIGTPAVSAREVLERQGYILREFETGLSWYGIVGKQTRTSVERPYRNAVTAADFDGPDGEKLSLAFVQTPGGAALSRVRLELPATLPPENLRSTFAERFGPSNCGQGWCIEPAVPSDGQQSGIATRVIADIQSRTITVDSSEQLQVLVEQSVAGAVKDCRRSRLGAPMMSPAYLLLAC
jgi:hypothetical protein